MLALKLFAQYDKKVTLSEPVLKELYLVAIGAATVPYSLAEYTKSGVYDMTSNLIVSSVKKLSNSFTDTWSTDCNAGYLTSNFSRCILRTSTSSLSFASTTHVSYILSIVAPPFPTEHQLYAGESINTAQTTDQYNYVVDLPNIFSSYYISTTTPDNHRIDIDVTATVSAQQASSTSNKRILLVNPSEWSTNSYPWQATSLSLKAYTEEPQMTLASTTLTSFATTSVATSTQNAIQNTVAVYFGEIYDSSNDVEITSATSTPQVVLISPESYAEFASTTLVSANDISKVFLATTTPQCVSNASTTQCDKEVRVAFFRDTIGNLAGFIPSQAATEEFWMVHKKLLHLPTNSSDYNFRATTTLLVSLTASSTNTYRYANYDAAFTASGVSSTTPSSCTASIYYIVNGPAPYNDKCFATFSLTPEFFAYDASKTILYLPYTSTTSPLGVPNHASDAQYHAAYVRGEGYLPASTTPQLVQLSLASSSYNRAGHLAYDITEVALEWQGGISNPTFAFYYDILSPTTCSGSCVYSLSTAHLGLLTIEASNTLASSTNEISFSRASLPVSLATSTGTSSINLGLVPSGLLTDVQFRTVYSSSTFALATTTRAISQDSYNEILHTPLRVDSDVSTLFDYALPFATSSCPGEGLTSSCVVSAQKTKAKDTVSTLSGFILSDAALEELYRVHSGDISIVNLDISQFGIVESTQTIITSLNASSTFRTIATSTGVFAEQVGVCSFGTQSGTSSKCYIAAPMLATPATKVLLSFDFATTSVATSTLLSTLTSASTTATSSITGVKASSTFSFDITLPYQDLLALNTTATSTSLVLSPHDIASSTIYTVTNPTITISRVIGTPNVVYDSQLAGMAFSRSEISAYATSTATTTVDLTNDFGLTFSTQFLSPFGAFAIATSTATTTTVVVATTSLRTYWKLDSNSTDTLGSYNGTDTSVSYSTSGKINNGASFNGSTSIISLDGAELPVTTTPNQTIVAWFKLNSTSAHGTIFDSMTTTGGTEILGQYLGTGYNYVRIGVLYQQIGTAYFKTQALNDTNWHQIAITVSNNNSMTAYFDGVSLGTHSMSSTGASVSFNHFGLGYDKNYVSGTTQNPLHGIVDEVSTWSRALSSTEIASLYNSGTALAYPFTIVSTSTSPSSYTANPSSYNPGIVNYLSLPTTGTTTSPSSIAYPSATSTASTTIFLASSASTTQQTIYTPFSNYSYNATSGVITTYFTLNGVLVGSYSYVQGNESGTKKLTYLLTNYLGTPVLETDEAGDIVQMDITDVFGNYVHRDQRNDSPYHNKSYTSHEFDDVTGNIYARARYLDPKAHTFLSVDPMLYKLPQSYLMDPQQMNSYAYARNNPITYTDPTGGYIESALDVGFILYDFNSLKNNLQEGNYRDAAIDGLALIGDGVGLAAPGATGIGLGIRYVSHGGDASKAFGGAKQVIDQAMQSPGLQRQKEILGKIGEGVNARVENMVKSVFRSEDKLPGGTFGAIKNEIQTGQKTGNVYHAVDKAPQTISRINNILKDFSKGTESLKPIEVKILNDFKKSLNKLIDIWNNTKK